MTSPSFNPAFSAALSLDTEIISTPSLDASVVTPRKAVLSFSSSILKLPSIIRGIPSAIIMFFFFIITPSSLDSIIGFPLIKTLSPST